MADDEQDETDTGGEANSPIDGIEIDWIHCPKCGAKYLTPRQVRAHQSKHSTHHGEDDDPDPDAG